MRKIVVLLALFSAAFLVGATRVYAQSPSPVALPRAANICSYAGAQQAACSKCMFDGFHTWTAIGCVDTNPTGFFSKILGLAIGIGGGIAFLLILFGGFQILTSAGNPEQLNAGREMISAAIAGLLLIIFSVFILRLIGYNIFGIPGFGG